METHDRYQTSTAEEGGASSNASNHMDGNVSPTEGDIGEERPAVIMIQPTNGTGGGASPASGRPVIIAQPVPSSVTQ